MRQDYDLQATGQLGTSRAAYQPVQHRRQEADVRPGLGTQLVQGLLQLGEQYTARKFQDQAEEAYFQGERARHLGEAFEDIKMNVFAKPFVRGGYQDHDFRLAQAEYSREVAAYIQKEGKVVSPEEFQKYLGGLTAKLLDRVGGGLSSGKRKEVMRSQMDLEASLQKMHTKAHMEYGIQQTGMRFGAQVKATINSMIDAKEAGVPTGHFVTQLAGFADSMQEDLPHELGAQVISNMVRGLFDADLYVEGSALLDGLMQSSVLSDLSTDYWGPLMSARQSAESRTRFARSAQAIAQFNALKQRAANGDVISVTELQPIIKALDGTFVNERDMLGLLNVATRVDQTEAKNRELADAWLRKDKPGIRRMGEDVSQAGDVAARYLLHNFSEEPNKAIAIMLPTALEMGEFPAPMLKTISGALNALVTSDDWTTLEGDKGIMEEVVNSIARLDANGQDIAIARLEAALPAQNQGLLPLMLSQPDRTLKDSITETLAIRNDESLTEGTVQNTQIRNKFKDEVEKEIKPGLIRNIWRGSKNLLGAGAAAPTADSAGYRMFEEAVYDRVQELANDKYAHILMSPKQLVARAAVDVEKNTIYLRPEDGDAVTFVMPSKNGYTPFRADIEAAVDAEGEPLAQGVRNEEIAQALQKLHKPAGKGQQVVYVTSPNGSIQVLQQDKETMEYVRESQYEVAAQEVAEQVAKDRDASLAKRVKAQVGAAHTVQDADGSKHQIVYNGKNSIGVASEAVKEWRDQLVQREGFRTKAYKDTGGYAIGIGHQVTDPKAEWSAEQIEQQFEKDSDLALRKGYMYAKRYGFEDDEKAVLALASASFQMGPFALNEFKNTLQHIAQGGDFDEFKQRAYTWKWYKQTPDRVEDFLKRVRHRFD